MSPIPTKAIITALAMILIAGLIALGMAGPEGTTALLDGVARIAEALTGHPPAPQP